MSGMDYTASPVTKYSAEAPGEKGETVSVVWDLTELNERKVPFESIDVDKMECIVELGGGSTRDSQIRIRFGLEKTQYPENTGVNKLNYLSLAATALSTGGREDLEFLVSLDYLNANLTVASGAFKDYVVQLKCRGDTRRKVVFKQLQYYSFYSDPYHREILEYFKNHCLLFGITVTELLSQGNEQPLQKVSSPHDGSNFKKSLQVMFESEKSYSDVKLQSKDNIVMDAHKFILAARSPILREMLNNQGEEEGAEGNLKIDNVNGAPLRSILHWMYTNSLDETADRVISEVMEGAKLLGLTGLLALIDIQLITICNPKNMMTLFSAALEHKMKTAVEDLRQYIREHLEDPALKI